MESGSAAEACVKTKTVLSMKIFGSCIHLSMMMSYPLTLNNVLTQFEFDKIKIKVVANKTKKHPLS